MTKIFKKLTTDEVAVLIKAPVLVSVLAASNDKKISENEKAEATKLAHLKTFTADPLLLPYYNEVEKGFKTYFVKIVTKYTPFNDKKTAALKQEIDLANSIIGKLDKEDAVTLYHSLAAYTEHVRKAEHSVLVDFLFPLPIKGVTY